MGSLNRSVLVSEQDFFCPLFPPMLKSSLLHRRPIHPRCYRTGLANVLEVRLPHSCENRDSVLPTRRQRRSQAAQAVPTQRALVLRSVWRYPDAPMRRDTPAAERERRVFASPSKPAIFASGRRVPSVAEVSGRDDSHLRPRPARVLMGTQATRSACPRTASALRAGRAATQRSFNHKSLTTGLLAGCPQGLTGAFCRVGGGT